MTARPHLRGFARRLLFAIALLASMACLAEASSAQVIAGPKGFVDDRDAALASDGKRLWIATTGMTRRNTTRTRVSVRQGGRWVQVGPLLTTDTGYGTHLFLRRAPGGDREICLARMVRRDRPEIACRRNGRWVELALPGPFRKFSLYDVQQIGGRSLVLLRRDHRGARGSVSQIRLARLEGDRIVPLKARIDRPGLWLPEFVQATTSTPGQRLELDLMEMNRGIRVIVARHGSRWTYSKPLTTGLGPLTNRSTATVRSGSSLIAPLVTMWDVPDGYGGRQTTVGSFVLRKLSGGSWSPAGEEIGTGFGTPQGGIYAIGNEIWALWQENDYYGVAFGGGLRTRVFAGRLKADGSGFDRELTLWTGRAFFPVQLGAIQHRGAPVFLYQRQLTPRSGLRTFVDLTAGR
ncbi:MAG: hypothetical protein J0H98_03640 [Solirubrobacterales bacterium]|nr:hypothetical protein [Solirubrobacterales bacterium]